MSNTGLSTLSAIQDPPKTIEEILDFALDRQTLLCPKLTAKSASSVRYAFNEPFAWILAECWKELEKGLDRLDVRTATGADLDIRVKDRLIEGRDPGEYATGYIKFSRNTAASEDYEIPVETMAIYISESGVKLFFVTTIAGVLPAGSKTVTISGRCATRGISGNIPPYQISSMYAAVRGIEKVTNPLPFVGGEESESDNDLRQRYYDTVYTQGRATKEILEKHLSTIEDVREVRILNHGYGDAQVIVDLTQGIDSVSQEIVNTIEENLGCGIMSRGCLAATIKDGEVIPDIGDTFGGYVFFRPLQHILEQEQIPFIFRDMTGIQKAGTVTIPAGTHRGSVIKAILPSSTDRAKSIPDFDYTGSNDYDILLGMGDAPYIYLYNLPEIRTVRVEVGFVQTDAPEPKLDELIQESVRAFLDEDFRIGDPLQYSDLVKFIFVDHATKTPYQGIDELRYCRITVGAQVIDSWGMVIEAEEDERFEPGLITVRIFGED